MSVDVLGIFALLLVPIAGLAAAVYLIATRRRKD
jgi:hypothetical protein